MEKTKNVTMETTKAIEKLEQAKQVLMALCGGHSVQYNVCASVSDSKYTYTGTVIISNDAQHTKTECDFTDFVNLLKANNLDEDYKTSINEACNKARQTYNKSAGIWAIHDVTNVKDDGTIGTNSKYDISHYVGDSNGCYNAIVTYLTVCIDSLKQNRGSVNNDNELLDYVDIVHLRGLLHAFVRAEVINSNKVNNAYKRLRQIKSNNKLFTATARELASCSVSARNGIGKNGNSFTLNKNSVKSVIVNMLAVYLNNQMQENALYNELYKALDAMELKNPSRYEGLEPYRKYH